MVDVSTRISTNVRAIAAPAKVIDAERVKEGNSYTVHNKRLGGKTNDCFFFRFVLFVFVFLFCWCWACAAQPPYPYIQGGLERAIYTDTAGWQLRSSHRDRRQNSTIYRIAHVRTSQNANTRREDECVRTLMIIERPRQHISDIQQQTNNQYQTSNEPNQTKYKNKRSKHTITPVATQEQTTKILNRAQIP